MILRSIQRTSFIVTAAIALSSCKKEVADPKSNATRNVSTADRSVTEHVVSGRIDPSRRASTSKFPQLTQPLSMERSTRPPTAREQADLDEWLQKGMDIMGHYGVDASVSIYINLDAVYEDWANDSSTNKPSQDGVLLGLGAVFGNRLAHKHSATWFMVTDQHGTDYAISIKGYEIYPMDFVAKRIATLDTHEPEFGFFTGMAEVSDTW